MSGKWRAMVMALGLAGAMAGPVLAQSEIRSIKPEQLPALVREAAQKAAPGVRWSKAFRGTIEGRTSYLLVGKDGKGREVEVETNDRGKIRSVETTVPMNEVPKNVLEVVRHDENAKNWKITAVKRSRAGDGKGESYTFYGPNEEGEIIGLISIAYQGK
jgi:hypothetical protein